MPRPTPGTTLLAAALSAAAAIGAFAPAAAATPPRPAAAGSAVAQLPTTEAVTAGGAAGAPLPAATPAPCTTPPPPPLNLTLLAVGPTSATLRWTIVVPSYGCSPAAFDVLRAPGASGGTFTPIGQTGLADTYLDGTVTPATTYRYQVRSRSADGQLSTPSNTVQVTTPDACTPTLPMGSLTVTATTPTSVSLTWAGPTNPACFAYDILRAPATGGAAFTLVGTTTGRSFSNTDLTPSTAYRYIVQGRIITTGATWGTTNAVLATTTQGCTLLPPPAPGNLTAISVTATSVTLNWAVTGAPAAPGCLLTYEVLRATDTGDTFALVGTTGGNTYTDIGLTPGTTYRYQARTRDAAGNLSAISHTVTVTTTGAPGCTASYRIVSAWTGGFQGEVTLTNTSTVASGGWQTTLVLSSGASIANLWGGRTSQTASPYTITNEPWNGSLAPNASATFGFNATGPGSTGTAVPTTCTLT